MKKRIGLWLALAWGVLGLWGAGGMALAQGEVLPPLLSGELPVLWGEALPGGPLPGEALREKPEYALGATIAVQGERIAFVGQNDELPTLRILKKQKDSYVLEALYTARQEISNVVLLEDGVAYLTGPTQWPEEEGAYTLEVRGAGQEYSMVLGPCRRPRPPYAGPLLRLGDGRLLLADNLGVLYLLQPDGAGLVQVSGAKVGNFAYHQGQVYFENLEDQWEYPQVYCRELGEYLPMAYPNLYAAALEGSPPRKLTEGGIQGLVSWGGKILYQDMGKPFVPPYDELPEDWLWGSLACWEANGERTELGMLPGRYLATRAGLAVWHGLWGGGGEHGEQAGRLALHDWEGRALRFLDAGPELAYAPWSAEGDALWFVKPDDLQGRDVLVRVPLDGSGAGEVVLGE